MLQEFSEQAFFDWKAQPFVAAKRFGEILPAARGHKAPPVRMRLHAVKMLRIQLQIGKNCRVQAARMRIAPPDGIAFLDLQQPHTIHRGRVEEPRGLVVLRWISGSGDHPALRQAMRAELLALQQLEHGRHQRLRDAVDLIQEEDPAIRSGLLHPVVDGSEYFAHGILRRGAGLSAVLLLPNERQSERALSRVVRHGVRDQSDVHFVRKLRQDCRLADARRPHQQRRPLMQHRNAQLTVLRPFRVGQHHPPQLLLGLPYIHPSSLPGLSASSTSVCAQRGMLISS